MVRVLVPVALVFTLAVTAVYLLVPSPRVDTPEARANSAGRLPNVSANDGLTFAVVGDTGTGGEEQAAVAGLLTRMKPGFVLHTGDVVYPAGEYDSYGPNFFTPYRELLNAAPILPVPGNHDVATRDGEPYLRTFDLPRNNPQDTERYYPFDEGSAHFVALDSELYYGDGGGARRRKRRGLQEISPRPTSRGSSSTCTVRPTAPPSTAAT